jgi:hypothetical protein
MPPVSGLPAGNRSSRSGAALLRSRPGSAPGGEWDAVAGQVPAGRRGTPGAASTRCCARMSRVGCGRRGTCGAGRAGARRSVRTVRPGAGP